MRSLRVQSLTYDVQIIYRLISVRMVSICDCYQCSDLSSCAFDLIDRLYVTFVESGERVIHQVRFRPLNEMTQRVQAILSSSTRLLVAAMLHCPSTLLDRDQSCLLDLPSYAD